MRIVARWLVIAAALVFAVAVVPGVSVSGNGWVAVLDRSEGAAVRLTRAGCECCADGGAGMPGA